MNFITFCMAAMTLLAVTGLSMAKTKQNDIECYDEFFSKIVPCQAKEGCRIDKNGKSTGCCKRGFDEVCKDKPGIDDGTTCCCTGTLCNPEPPPTTTVGFPGVGPGVVGSGGGAMTLVSSVPLHLLSVLSLMTLLLSSRP